MIAPRPTAALALATCLAASLAAPPARAGNPAATPSVVKEASKHFQRGVALYTEADYRAALVEFRRAYELAPNAGVLYNLGQTYYQLQNYALALTTLERYLAEAPPSAPHRGEVEQSIETLRSRVGKIRITTSVDGCEITVDDELVGKSPLTEPVLVSIGRRKITAIHADRAPETRFVDVAAGDTAKVALTLPDPASAAPAPAAAATGLSRRDLITPGWITTGVLGATALGLGTYAFFQSRSLADARGQLGASAADLDARAGRAFHLALAADIVGVAAIATGLITWRLGASAPAREVRVGFTHQSVQLSGAF